MFNLDTVAPPNGRARRLIRVHKQGEILLDSSETKAVKESLWQDGFVACHVVALCG